MYAIIQTGGKQYKVVEGGRFRCERLHGLDGGKVIFDKVLMIGGTGAPPQVGTPHLSGATVEGEIVDEGLGKKVLLMKKKRRKGYRRTQGHRQGYTEVKVTKVSAG